MRTVVSELSDDDFGLLAAIADSAGVPRVEVVRWAIRYYTIHGPWTEDSETRLDALGGARRLVVGPGREGMEL